VICGIARREQNSRRLLVSARRERADPHCVSEPADDGDGVVLRYRKASRHQEKSNRTQEKT